MVDNDVVLLDLDRGPDASLEQNHIERLVLVMYFLATPGHPKKKCGGDGIVRGLPGTAAGDVALSTMSSLKTM